MALKLVSSDVQLMSSFTSLKAEKANLPLPTKPPVLSHPRPEEQHDTTRHDTTRTQVGDIENIGR